MSRNNHRRRSRMMPRTFDGMTAPCGLAISESSSSGVIATSTLRLGPPSSEVNLPIISLLNVEAWHPLPGAPLRLRLGSSSGLSSAGLFGLGWFWLPFGWRLRLEDSTFWMLRIVAPSVVEQDELRRKCIALALYPAAAPNQLPVSPVDRPPITILEARCVSSLMLLNDLPVLDVEPSNV